MRLNPLFAALLAVFSLSCCRSEFAPLYEDLPFDMPVLERPSIPSRTVSIKDFGAVADGFTLNTVIFNDAIEELAAKGGGTLNIPAGIYLTGPITLKSNICLNLEKGALLLFSTDRNDYPVIDTNFEGLDIRRCTSPINATGVHDIAITGEGIIDGNGDSWREVKRRKVGDDQWKRILKKGGVLSDDGKVWYPDEGYKIARATAGNLNKQSEDLDENEIISFLRPVMVSLRECENVLLEGVTFQNSPCWNIHPLWCKNVIVKDINVRNPYYSANGDGIDIDGCENVIVVGSTFDVGDDAICIKSGKDEDGRRHAKTCRNLIIDACTVYHGHGGFVVGSEMSGGVENIVVRNCDFLGTDVGLRFKSTRGRGGEVKDIWCENIRMKDIVTYAIVFNLYYAGVAATEMSKEGAAEEVQADETTPYFHDIYISGITCSGAAQAVYLNGLPELPLRYISIENSDFIAEKGVEIHNAIDIIVDGVSVNGEEV